MQNQLLHEHMQRLQAAFNEATDNEVDETLPEAAQVYWHNVANTLDERMSECDSEFQRREAEAQYHAPAGDCKACGGSGQIDDGGDQVGDSRPCPCTVARS